MRLLLVISALVSVLAMPVSSFAKNVLPDSATIGFIPGEDPEWLKKNGVELAKALQQKLNVPINIYISKDYNGLVEAMKDKKIDFAFYSAVTFVDAEKKADAKVLLKKVWDTPYYFSVIAVKKNSKINSIKDLRGKRFGYVDEKSASGYLYPRVMMLKKGIDPDHFFKETKFFGQHEGSVKALSDDQVDGIAVFANSDKNNDGAWTQYLSKEKQKEFKVIWVSDPIPNDPFCVRQDFYDTYPHFTHDMMFALIDFRDEPPEKNILKTLYGISTMELATSKQYDPVRELVKYLNLKKH